MDILEILTKAINQRKPIIFEYDVDNKVKGKRYGHPYAVFTHPTSNNVMVHIYQTDGVSDTKDEIPGWRSPLLMHIKNIEILENKECFDILGTYKSNSPMYSRVFAKV
ncbi:hypothetical protein [uncultured Acetobacteroides sp.]|uniref:hypothetical protein n=1 Tax=uncultured Acetobacteroides sp. TaxID=1760811 RepID=UPI0029F4A9E1|nr:hypothetical protein [uncultured Acetobacteroides sp.]